MNQGRDKSNGKMVSRAGQENSKRSKGKREKDEGDLAKGCPRNDFLYQYCDDDTTTRRPRR